ncbi:hypothetical protein [Sulfitobacter sp. 1A12779]|uniref:hypothetical protein n=1 Tax=Sulfitobacter sp. 1A12779 TaxID=3368599 RepID=UPI0037460683
MAGDATKPPRITVKVAAFELCEVMVDQTPFHQKGRHCPLGYPMALEKLLA